jgi:hypothetical protein
MEYQVGQMVRIKQGLDYDNPSGAKYHYVTREIIKASGKVGKIEYAEKYNSEIFRYQVSVDGDLIYWMEDAWLMPHLLDNRSI